MNENSTQAFLSKYISDGNSYKKRVLLPVICVIASLILFALALGFGIAANGGVKSLLMQWVIMLLLVLFVAGSVVFLRRVGANLSKNALVFCLVNDTTLYAIDARPAVDTGAWRTSIKFIYSFFKTVADTANTLDRIAHGGMLEEDARTGKIDAYATRITQIKKLQHISGKRFAECDVITNTGRSSTQKYDISNHTEELFKMLELRCVSGKWETGKNTYTKQICVSALLLLVCLGLCIASYPTVGLLPEAVYFPSLFALGIPVILLGVFALKRRRGE